MKAIKWVYESRNPHSLACTDATGDTMLCGNHALLADGIKIAQLCVSDAHPPIGLVHDRLIKWPRALPLSFAKCKWYLELLARP